MSIRIYFSNGSIRNTTLSCDSLGIHYTVSKTGGVISLARWDSETNSNVTAGEIEFRLLEKDKIRIGQDGEWQSMKEYLSRENVISRYLFCKVPVSMKNADSLASSDPIGPGISLPIMEFVTDGKHRRYT
jgi:hypothetical protein